jgi:AcrR family transcriptional regulator
MVTKSLNRSKECNGTHDLILDAAQDALKDQGYKGMTMDDLATRAGIGKGTLYLYFESKEDVALSVFDRSNQRLQTRLKAILRGPGTASERLRAMIIERVMYRFECAQGYSHGIDDLMTSLRPQLFERRERYYHAESLVISEALIEGRALKEFSLDEPFAVADSIITATSYLLPYSLSPKQLGARDILQSRTEFLADLLLKAVQNHRSDNSRRESKPTAAQTTD